MTGTFSSGPVFAVLIAATIASTDSSGSDVAERAKAVPAIAEYGPRQSAADVLKHEYLKCDRAATEARLDTDSAARCSFVYEALRERVFNGDFDALLAWWRHTRQDPGMK